MVVSRSRTYAHDYGDVTVGGAELDEIKSLRVFGVTFDSKLTFEIHFFRCFNAYVLSNLDNCAPVGMSSWESHLSLLDSVVCSAKRSEGELFCLGYRRKDSVLCLLFKIYHRSDYPLHEYLHHFVSVCNTKTLAALWEVTLVTPRCRTVSFSRSFLPVAGRLFNLLP